MIVVDTNCIAYFFLDKTRGERLSEVLKIDKDWVAPTLWQSEFCHVLLKYFRIGALSMQQAFVYQQRAELLMKNRSFRVSPFSILELAANSGCSTYDCEFVVLAKEQDCKLITADKKLLAAFPETAITVEDFLAA